MTDAELMKLEQKAKVATPGPWKYEDPIIMRKLSEISWQGVSIKKRHNMVYIAAANPVAILELIADLRQARKERDWLARIFGTLPDRECPPNRRRWSDECCKMTCEECWLEAAKESIC